MSKLEYGDYQTPDDLARATCRLLKRLGIRPKGILEPTCGLGSFLALAFEEFARITTLTGFDINADYIEAAKARLRQSARTNTSITLRHASFFDLDWQQVTASLPEPILILGNPPWVTSAALGSIQSSNLPEKSNFQCRKGIDALTGKSNFDISEFMLLKLCDACQGKRSTLAMLCKTAVARKVITYCWRHGLALSRCRIFPIDAMRAFGASVEACLLVAEFGERAGPARCMVYDDFDIDSPCREIGDRNGRLVADLERYDKWEFLRGDSSHRWRSGVKHDCAKVMEFRSQNGHLVNGLGEKVQLEETFVYPLVKGSGIGNSASAPPRRVLVTQQKVGDDTSPIASTAPKTWQYLLAHASWLDRRASTIYRNRARFGMFGVGDYSFAPWKVAISGFRKGLDFERIGPEAGRPVMLDDTAYFLSFAEKEAATRIWELLNSEPAHEFLSSMIFWDSKRPITVEVLNQLSLEQLQAATRSTSRFARRK